MAEYHANPSYIKEIAKHGSKEHNNVVCYEDLKIRIVYGTCGLALISVLRGCGLL